MRRYTAYAIIMFLCSLSVFSQYDKVDIQMPTATSLMRYTDYPVSHKTGIPDIKIPLHTLKAGDKIIPIELSFHIDNFMRSNQIPESTGAGWTLNTNIQISRSINGKDDFKAGGYCNVPAYPGPFDYNDQGSDKDVIRDNLYKSKLSVDGGMGGIDGESDKYYYNILGKSGTFYLQRVKDKPNEIKCISVPLDGVKIILVKPWVFTIIDTDGTKYLFEGGGRDYRTPTNYYDESVIAWKCKKIVSPNGDEIEFVYNTVYKPNGGSIVEFTSRLELYDDQRNYAGPYDDRYSQCNGGNYLLVKETPFWKIIGPKMKRYAGYGNDLKTMNAGGAFEDSFSDYPVGGSPSATYWYMSSDYLDEIRFRGGKVLFTYKDNSIMTSIKIVDNQGKVTKAITLEQEGGGNNQVYSDQFYNRILKTLKINDETYSFHYGYQRKGYVEADFWGYNGGYPGGEYGGAGSMANLEQDIDVQWGQNPWGIKSFWGCEPISNPYVWYHLLGKTSSDIFNVRPDFTLLKIKYPTGGCTEFIVGQNLFRSRFDNQIKGAGGYRIQRIKFYDGINTNPIKEKIYKYGPAEDGTGIIRDEPSFSSYPKTDYTEQVIKYYLSDINPSFFFQTERKRVFLGTSTRAMTFGNGSPINYNEVSEYESDMGRETGKTVYKYDLKNYVPAYTSPTDPYPFEQEEWDMGMLDSVIIYKYNSSLDKYEWQKRKKYVYNAYYQSAQIFREKVWMHEIPEVITGLNRHYLDVLADLAVFYHKYNGLKTGVMQLIKEVEYIKEKEDILIEETEYYYDNPNKYTTGRKIKKLSDGTVLAEQTTYPEDYLSGNFIADLLGKNMTSFPIEKISYRNGNIISGEFLNYNISGQISTVDHLEDNIAITDFKLSNKGTNGKYTPDTPNTIISKDNRYKQKFALIYDSYGNIKNIVPQAAFPIVYLWSYSGRYPIAEIKNATLTEVTAVLNSVFGVNSVDALSALATPNEGKLKDGSLQRSLPDALVTTYTYQPLVGLLTVTNPSGTTVYYEYDTFGRLKRTKDVDGKTIQEYDYHYQNQ